MTARIATSMDFQAGVYFAGEFYMNVYEVDLQFNVETESIREQNIALDRIKYFLTEQLEHSVMCLDREEVAIEKYLDAGLKVCTLPEEPYDQIVGIMLLSKLNAIAEGRLVVTDITIGSKMSDGVSCMHSMEENLGPFASRGWWKESSMSMNNLVPKSKGKKVVKLSKPKNDWEDLMLAWEEPTVFPKNTPSTEIVFASFDNKTDK